MQIKLMETFDIDALKRLYKSVHWTVYLDSPSRFKEMFKRSLCVLGAYEGEELVGLVRVVGDNAHILYIQDIIVDPAHQRKGIGTKLFEEVLSRFAHVRQKVLMTDLEDVRAHAFYKKFGFHETTEKGVTCFVRFDKSARS